MAEGTKDTSEDVVGGVEKGEEERGAEQETSKFSCEGARQATNAVSSYTRPAGGGVSVAGVLFSSLQVHEE